MGPADPSYPLYPIANIISSVMLLLVLMTSFVRQSWNLGVAFLCFWLFFENVTSAVNAIVWSANADIKLYVYCDIVTHLQVITYIVKPMGTLIITRRLHLIASLQSVELPSKSVRHWDRAVEWTLGLIIPILVAGPIYFVNQGARFEVAGGLGCTTTPQTSILEILVFESWTIIPPLVSILFYYPKVAYTYYRQRRDIHSFLHSSPSVSRTNYLRILILASIDILLTLPISIVNLTLGIVETYSSIGHIPLYPGWTFLHADWEPPSLSYNELQASGTAQLARSYFTEWTSPILAFTIFALFGLTSEARASYMRLMYSVCGRFGWKLTPRARNGRTSLGEIQFGAGPQNSSGFNLEIGSRPPSFINADVAARTQSVEDTLSGCPARESDTDLKSVEEARYESTSNADELRAAEGLRTSIIGESSGGTTASSEARTASSSAKQSPNGTENSNGRVERKLELEKPEDTGDTVAVAADNVKRSTQEGESTGV